jgi:TPR repeat protein
MSDNVFQRASATVGKAVRRGVLLGVIAGATVTAAAIIAPVEAGTMRQGIAAFNRENFVSAARILEPYAERGDSVAQTYMGFMYETGRGVPQNYTMAAHWYRRAAEQGNDTAQYTLGLLYDKGFGVRRDLVEANKWLNLSAAAGTKDNREYRARMRDAVTTKMTRGQISAARQRAVHWYPLLE